MTLLEQLLTLATAGTVMLSSALTTAAPQNDVKGLLFLQNRQWRVSSEYEPETVIAQVAGHQRALRQDAAQALEKMYADCLEQTGRKLTSVSGYRSYQRQATMYENKVEATGSKKKADEYVARAGASEHQLGLAMDVGQANTETSFGRTTGGKWVAEHCWEYGFILRYKEGWEDVTGYKDEPWHVRYVGLENARRIHEQEMPLETYLLLLREETLLDIVIGEKTE